MPPKLYDDMFYMEIRPAPQELVRVGMVFDVLDGQWNAASWVTELKDVDKTLQQAAADLCSSNFHVRDRATTTLARAGNRARSVLVKLTHSGDAEVKARATKLLKEISSEMDWR